MELKSISEHRPKGMIIDVPEEEAEELLKTGEFVKNVKENLIVEKKKKPKYEEKTKEFEDKKNFDII